MGAGANPTSDELVEAVRAAYSEDPMFEDTEYTSRMELNPQGLWLMKGGKVVAVPHDPVLRSKVISLFHDPPTSGHMGMNKTMMAVSQWFWWSTLRADVCDYVSRCDACQRDKPSLLRAAGMHRPLSIPGRRWESVHFDMIVKLPTTVPEFKGGAKYDSILVFVDRLSKMVHLVATVEAIDARQFARLYVDNVCRLHGASREVTSDRGPQFNNMFIEHVWAILGTDQRLSSAYHPQTNGQVERVNRVIEEMLRHYVKPDQTDWDRHLAMCEFAINNAVHASTQHTPFYLNTGQHPLIPAVLSLPEHTPAAADFVHGIDKALSSARASMALAQAKAKAMVDLHRRDVVYAPGDLVLLDTRNPSKKGAGVRKLKPKFMGPYKVLRMCGPVAAELKLPEQWTRVHNVFHVSLLKPYMQPTASHSAARADQPGPPPVDWEDGEPIYKVERIMDHRVTVHSKRAGKKRTKKTEELHSYLVRWAGHSADQDSWEPRLPNLQDCGAQIREYKALKGLAIEDADWDDDEEKPRA